MDLTVEIKESKIYLSWIDIKADLYKLFMKKEDNLFYECASVSGQNSLRLSLLPYGLHECFIQAIKDGKLIAESGRHQFLFDEVDVEVIHESDKEVKFVYSKYEQADGYRLYKDESGVGFNGCKNSDTDYVKFEIGDEKEFKVKPFVKNGEKREFIASSPVVNIDSNQFVSLSVYKSFNYNMFLSWDFQGVADGFLVYTENSQTPIFETTDGLCHCLSLFDYKGSTNFIVKAFVNTINGRLITAVSRKVSLGVRRYKKPEVSLIIPAYNAQDYIVRSIDSALASDFSNLEIIIVNDGSTDDTQKIIDWYDKNYPNVVSIVKENGGVADARNAGIKEAKGKYIAFMDNDDLIRPNMISKLYNSAEENKCDIAIAPLYRITDGGYTVHCNLPFAEDVPVDIDKYLEIMYTPGYYNCAIWNKLYKASMVKEHPLGKLKYEDVSWTPCILSYAENICFLKTPLYEWDRKTRPETFGDVLARQNEDDLFENRKEAMLFFIKNGNPDKRSYLRTIAKRRLSRYAKNSKNKSYQEMIDKIEAGKL